MRVWGAAIVVALASGVLIAMPSSVVRVQAGVPVAQVIAASPPGSTIVLGPGVHAPFAIERPMRIRGDAGTIVFGGIDVRADDVRLVGLTVIGGADGIHARDVRGLVIDAVTIRGSTDHGISLNDVSAVITGCTVQNLVAPWAQGIELRNANGRPRTLVLGCTVSGGQEGIVAHVSRLEARGNVIDGTTMRAISITEMSEGIAIDNRVTGSLGIALYCGDLSTCSFERNVVDGVREDPGVTSRAGYGVVGYDRAVVRARGNLITGAAAADPVGMFIGSRLTTGFDPIAWPAPEAAGVDALTLSVIAAAIASAAARAAFAPERRAARARRPKWDRRVTPAELKRAA